jgi:hypothetical protein
VPGETLAAEACTFVLAVALVAGPPALVAPCALVIWGSVAVYQFALSVPAAARDEAAASPPGAVAFGATDLIAFAVPVGLLVVNSGDLVLVAPEVVAALTAVAPLLPCLDRQTVVTAAP